MPKLPEIKKLVISGILSIFLLTNFLFVFAPSARAQTPAPTWYNQSLPDWYSKVYGSPANDVFGERYTAAQVDWIIWSVITWLPTKIVGSNMIYCALQKSGIIGQVIPVAGRAAEIGACLASKKIFGEVPLEQLNKGYALKENKNFLQFMFEDRPLSGITYFKNVARNWHIIPEVKAQNAGFGFSALNPILPLWRAARNAAYGILVLAILILSFMIMLRVKIDPQTAVTIQSAIPRIVFALILITFSYAIAGFLVDLMYVVIGLLALLLNSVVSIGPNGVFNLLTNGVPLGVDPGVPGAFILTISYFLIFALILIGLAGILLGILVAASVVTGGAAAIIIFIFAAILLVVIIWFSIRTIFTLFKAFAMVLLLTIFAPLQIVVGTIIPAFGFSRWLRSFVSNLAVFITVGFLLILAYIFLGQAAGLLFTPQGALNALLGVLKNNPFFGPIISIGILEIQGVGGAIGIVPSYAAWPPLLGTGGNTGAALVMLGASFIVFSIVPSTAQLIQSLIQGQPFAYGTAIGQAVLGPLPTLGPLAVWGGKVVGGVSKTAEGWPAISGALGNLRPGKTKAS